MSGFAFLPITRHRLFNNIIKAAGYNNCGFFACKIKSIDKIEVFKYHLFISQ
jgi:hypothetical protein